MPLQNRVTPFGEIEADPARGLWLGNRGGRFHRDDRTLGRRRHASRAWIYCVLSFKGRRRAVMGPGYTELFFLDEPTALAAGHRPCFECQRARAIAFAEAWGGGTRMPAPEMDRSLHAARLGPRAAAEAGTLPDGAMVEVAGAALLLAGGRAFRWSHAGYAPAALPEGPVTVLTPAPILAVLRAGFRVAPHPTAT